MDKKSIVFLLVITIVKSDDFDCEQPPPSNVDPFTCCAVNKPFNRFNFPECFPYVEPSATVRSIRTTERNYPLNNDRYYNRDDSYTTYRNIPNNNRRYGYSNNDNNNKNNNNGYRTRYRDRQDDNDYDDGRNRPQNRDYGARRPYDDHYHHGPPFWAHHHDWNQGQSQYRSERRYRTRRQIKWTTARRVKQLRQIKLESGNCAIQCIFNQTKVIKNNRLDRDAALVVYAKYYPEIPLDLLTKSVNKCAKHVISLQNRAIINTNRNRITTATKQCQDGSGVFAACFNREIFTNCPNELRSDSDDCNSLRDYIDNCSPVGGVREFAEFAFNASIILPDYS